MIMVRGIAKVALISQFLPQVQRRHLLDMNQVGYVYHRVHRHQMKIT